MNESGHAQLRLLETAAFFRLRSNSEKFRNHCVHASSLDLKRAVLKSREGTPAKPALFDDAIYGRLHWREKTRLEEQFRPGLGSR